MPRYHVTAVFADSRRAHNAAKRLSVTSFLQPVMSPASPTSPLSTREARFMGRIVLVVIGWSVIGTAIGAALGAVLALTVGPSGTQGLIIQVVSWAIFAHLLIGMWAGYILLADRTESDLPAVRDATPVVLSLQCATIDETERLTAGLRSLGASEVKVTGAGEQQPQYQI